MAEMTTLLWIIVAAVWSAAVFRAGTIYGRWTERSWWQRRYDALKRRLHASNYGVGAPPWQ